MFPTDLKDTIQAVPVPLYSRGNDQMAWKYSSKGGFDMKSAYVLANNLLGAETFSGKWIWSTLTLPRIQNFLWRCMHNSIGVREALARRGMSIDTTCPLCNVGVESMSHAFRDCPMVRTVWVQLGMSDPNSTFFSQDIRNWLKSNATAKPHQVHQGVHWYILFPFAIWLIWKQQNQVVFKNKGINPTLAKVITAQAMEFFHCVSYPRNNRHLVIKQLRWKRPNEGWLKLNTDDTTNDTQNAAGAGGVLRDARGNWVVGFSRKVGKSNSFGAEIWGICNGLILCNQMNIDAIIIELDAKALVDAFNKPSHARSVVSHLFEDCRQLANRIPHLHILHIYCEANKCADRLAKLGLHQSLDFVIHSSPPVDIIASFEADCQGLFVNKSCPVSCNSA